MLGQILSHIIGLYLDLQLNRKRACETSSHDLNILREHRLVCKLRGCEFLRSHLNYLGHNISSETIGVEERRVHAIRCWER
jgi:hypothetical protein